MSIPESRIEAILSDILGYEVDLEHPKSRVEELLVALGALVGNTPQLDNEGLIPISYLPPVAFADCITVADQTARYALTTDDVQNGDTVYQNDTQVMYFVVDDTKLDRADGYKALAAGIAAQAVADKNGDDITTTYQTIIDPQHKLNADLVDDSTATHKFATSAQLSQIATNETNILTVENVIDEISDFTYVTKSRSSMAKYPTNGYIDSSTGAVVPFAQYEIYYATIPASGELYINDQTKFAQVVIYSGAFPNSTMVKNGSTTSGTLPTVNNKMSVEKGQTVVVSSKDNFELTLPNGYEVKYNLPQIKFEKIDSNHVNIYVPSTDGKNTLKYVFVKYQKSWDSLSYTDGGGNTQTATNVVSSDYWNNTEIYNELNGDYIAQGNSNFITKVVGADAHAGNGHGNEVMLYSAFLCDGQLIDIDAMQNYSAILCSNCRYISNSNVFKVGSGSGNEYTTAFPDLDTSGNPIINFLHKMEMQFEIGNRITINNKLIVKQDNITFAQCHGAMLECNFGDITTIICNNSETTRNLINSEGTVTVPVDSTINLRTNYSQRCDYVEMYGGNYFIRQKMEQDDVTRSAKSRVVFEYYSNRVKSYFQPVIATYGKQSGETAEVFNTDDVISVTDIRVIETLNNE